MHNRNKNGGNMQESLKKSLHFLASKEWIQTGRIYLKIGGNFKNYCSSILFIFLTVWSFQSQTGELVGFVF